MLHEIVPWLKDNASWLSAVVSVATALVLVLRWVIERKAKCRPILVFREEIVGEPNCNRDLYIENKGYGPARNIVRRINSDPLNIFRSEETLLVEGTLSPGEKPFARYSTLPNNSAIPILDDLKFHATIEYDDNLGGHYKSVYRDKRLTTRRVCWRRMPSHKTNPI
jgi:hypothetical protein